MNYLDFSDDTILLIGKQFAFIKVLHFDEMYVEYAIKQDNELVSYNISSYVASKFDEIDREGITQPQLIADTLFSIFTIWSRGLPRHCEKILNGDIAWLDDYNDFELAGSPKKVKDVIKSYLNQYLK